MLMFQGASFVLVGSAIRREIMLQGRMSQKM
jgi:hypothetical protein